MRIVFALLLMVSSASASTMTGTVQNDLAVSGDSGPIWIGGPYGIEIEVLPPPYFPNERADGLILAPVDPPGDPVAAPLPPSWLAFLGGLGLLGRLRRRAS